MGCQPFLAKRVGNVEAQIWKRISNSGRRAAKTGDMGVQLQEGRQLFDEKKKEHINVAEVGDAVLLRACGK